jgi:hypothetical protein
MDYTPTEKITTEAESKAKTTDFGRLSSTSNKHSGDSRSNKQRKKKQHKRQLRASHTNG